MPCTLFCGRPSAGPHEFCAYSTRCFVESREEAPIDAKRHDKKIASRKPRPQKTGPNDKKCLLRRIIFIPSWGKRNYPTGYIEISGKVFGGKAHTRLFFYAYCTPGGAMKQFTFERGPNPPAKR